jgi:hypothetical protein
MEANLKRHTVKSRTALGHPTLILTTTGLVQAPTASTTAVDLTLIVTTAGMVQGGILHQQLVVQQWILP